jgi:hypothetical protein
LSETLEQIRRLVTQGAVRISDHGYDELASDEIFATEVLSGLASAELVEDYPNYAKGPCVLVLQTDAHGSQFMWFREFPRGRAGRPFWLLPIAPIGTYGKMASSGDAHEHKARHEAGS